MFNIRKYLAVFVVVAAASFLGSVDYSVADDNLIANPSVEIGTGGFPNGWSREKLGNNTAIFDRNADGQDGAKALGITVTKYVAGYSGWFFNPISADAGASYRYNEYYKASGPTSLFVRVTNTSGKVSTTTLLSDIASSSDWKRLEVEFALPSDAKSFTVIHRMKSLGALFTDNFSLSKKGDSAPVVDIVPPTAAVIAPIAGTTVSGDQTLAADASDVGGVTGVQFMIDDTVFGSEDTSAPYSVVLDTKTLADGMHTVSVRARDVAGNAATSSVVSFIVNNAPVLPTPPTPDPVVNIIPNPSLETVNPANAALPLSWKKTKSGTNNATFSYLKTGHTGSRSLQVKITQHTSGVAFYSFAPQTIEADRTYEYSMQYKSDMYAETDAEITLADGTVKYEYLGVVYPSPSGWSKFSTRISMPKNAKSVTIYSLIYSAGYLTTDDYSLTPVTIVPFKKPSVTLTFDDYFTSFYDNAFPLFKKYGMVGTMFLVSGDLDKPGLMTSAQLHEIQDYGFEIGAHTISHPHLPLLTPAQMDDELGTSRDTIAQYMGAPVESFATPYGEYNSEVLAHIKKFYASHRSVDVGYNTKDNYDRYNVHAMSATSATSPETVLAWVDEAIKDGANLSIVYHDIVDNGTTWSNTPAHLDTVLAGLKSRGVRVLTSKQAVDEMSSQME
ncbi:MAG: polysaccharide deacetylase family protein [Candidatus Moranbacteria bacterium]|nr:polysaccharide deacetylase family protein [Candidatus Moranbacteria bacterium]